MQVTHFAPAMGLKLGLIFVLFLCALPYIRLSSVRGCLLALGRISITLAGMTG